MSLRIESFIVVNWASRARSAFWMRWFIEKTLASIYFAGFTKFDINLSWDT